MWTDSFTLTDKDGIVLGKKNMVQHLKPIIDEHGLGPDDVYTIKSEVTGWEFKVTAATTIEEWRKSANDCLKSMDLRRLEEKHA